MKENTTPTPQEVLQKVWDQEGGLIETDSVGWQTILKAMEEYAKLLALKQKRDDIF